MSEPTAWLALTVSGKREHGGNDGYPDVPNKPYRWDSTVPHAAVVAVGDVIALWDKHTLLGVSVIEEIRTTQTQKPIYKCPNCGNSSIKARSVQRPTYRCYGCKHEFDLAIRQDKEVTSYSSQHEAAWIDLAGALSGSELPSFPEPSTASASSTGRPSQQRSTNEPGNLPYRCSKPPRREFAVATRQRPSASASAKPTSASAFSENTETPAPSPDLPRPPSWKPPTSTATRTTQHTTPTAVSSCAATSIASSTWASWRSTRAPRLST